MNDELASDEVTDAIAHIEMHRQEAVKESGLAHACAEALRKLHDLLEQVRAETQQTSPQGGHSPDLEAVNVEIRKVKSLAGNAGHDNSQRPARAKQQQPQQPSRGGPHGPARNKGRRTMGRSSGR
jgi:hypothetical protein